jgi:hypothetical protein
LITNGDLVAIKKQEYGDLEANKKQEYGDLKFDRDTMVRKWVADGFISSIHEARDRFDELINWNVIQPVEDGHSFGEEPTYRVRPMVLPILVNDFENNEEFGFLTEEVDRALQQNCKLRRLDVSQGQLLMDTNIDLSKVRSITIRGSVNRQAIEALSKKATSLRVLDLDDCIDVESCLDDICKMDKLEYLSLKRTNVTNSNKLNNIISKLKLLQTLDLRETPVLRKKSKELKLPQHLLYCPGVCIEANVGVPLPKWVKVLQADVDCDGSTAKLSVLEVMFQFQQQDGFSDNDRQTSSWPDEALGIERIKVAGRCVSLPDCIKQSQWQRQLGSVASLDIRVVELKDGDLEVLGSMKSLKRLVLTVAGISSHEIRITAGTGFPKLEVLALDFHAHGFAFQEGAMPELRSLYLKLHAGKRERTLLSGIRHLAKLSEVTLKCSKVYKGSDSLEKATAEVVEEVRGHPKPITVYIIEDCKGSDCHKDKEATADQMEEAPRCKRKLTITTTPSIPRIQVPEEIRNLRRIKLLRKLKQLILHYVFSEHVRCTAVAISSGCAVARKCAVALPYQLHDLWHDRFAQLVLLPVAALVLVVVCILAILYLVDTVMLPALRRFPTGLANWILSRLPSWSRIWLTNWLLKWLANWTVQQTIFAFFLFTFLLSCIIPRRCGRETLRVACILLSVVTILMACGWYGLTAEDVVAGLGGSIDSRRG